MANPVIPQHKIDQSKSFFSQKSYHLQTFVFNTHENEAGLIYYLVVACCQALAAFQYLFTVEGRFPLLLLQEKVNFVALQIVTK